MDPKNSPSIVAPSNGLNRRTLLTAGAWSVPAVAVMATAPLAAATTETRDLAMFANGGSTVEGFSADGTRKFEQGVAVIGTFFTLNGTQPTPAGSVLRFTWDGRLFPAEQVTVTVSGVALELTPTATGAHSRQVTYVVSQPVPASTDPGDVNSGLSWRLDLGRQDFDFYAEDVAPFSYSVAAPAGFSDPDPSNNGFVSEAVYLNV